MFKNIFYMFFISDVQKSVFLYGFLYGHLAGCRLRRADLSNVPSSRISENHKLPIFPNVRKSSGMHPNVALILASSKSKKTI